MDLREAMQALYKTGEYFATRELERDPDFEEAYWGEIVDPDGIHRDRADERDQYIADIRHVLDMIQTCKPGSLLDVGCGLGFFLSALGDSWRAYGIEPSRVAAKEASKYGVIHIGTLLDCPFEEDQFDVVLMYHVIEHLDDPVANLLKVRQLLTSQGLLILGTPDFDSGCARRFGSNYRLLHDVTHRALFSNDSMHRFLRDHSFHIQKVEYPFFDTRFFTMEHLARLFDTSQVSPPFYGNFMTFFCRNDKEVSGEPKRRQE